MIRDYWIDPIINESIAELVKSGRIKIEAHPDYGKPLIDLSNKSHFDSMGNYWDNRSSSTERLFRLYDLYD